MSRGGFSIPFKITVGVREGADNAEMSGKMCGLPSNTSLSFRPWLTRIGFLLSPIYPHFGL